jgi:CO/xanthine dehydrogenase Mo-binding subunit
MKGLAVLVALLARKAGRPVRIEYSRAEELSRAATGRRPICAKIGIQPDGTPTASTYTPP